MTITVNREKKVHYNKKRYRRLMQILHLKSVCRKANYQALPDQTRLHDTDGIPRRIRRVKNSTPAAQQGWNPNLRFVNFFIISSVYLTGGTSNRSVTGAFHRAVYSNWQEKDRECYILCPLFLTSTAFVDTNAVSNWKWYADRVSVILLQATVILLPMVAVILYSPLKLA